MGKELQMGFTGAPQGMPDWVPPGALHYIAHTESGTPIRGLARAAGCHASTILRQIRKLELRRDDPLVDAALRRLGAARAGASAPPRTSKPNKVAEMAKTPIPDDATLDREAMRVLRRLCETGAVLAVAAELHKAVVVRDRPSGRATRTAVVDAPVAQAMALKDWIAPSNTGRIIRYHITGTGRSALAALMERFGGPVDIGPGLAEAAGDFTRPAQAATEDDASTGRNRYTVGESPLAALARRRDKDGQVFLSDALVHAGERLREDFELAQMDASVAQNWDNFLTAGTQSGYVRSGGSGAPAEARARVKAALDHLGTGLADVALRCCCYLEGLETTEKRLGWSARSGKIVLRIALIRLKRHYDETVGPGGPLIG